MLSAVCISHLVSLSFSVCSFDTNQVHLAGTSGQHQPGQQGQHIYTEYQSLGPNNGFLNPHGGPKEGQRPTLREPLVYIPVAGPDGNRVPLVKVRKTYIICCKSCVLDVILMKICENILFAHFFSSDFTVW